MNLKIIIPAAGYGKRMGSYPAKELLPHPHTGKPFILETLERHQPLKAPFHIISRKDKLELNQYVQKLKNQNISLELQEIEPSKEWPDTVLKSKPYWSLWNLLLLPDTDYSPLLSPQLISECLANPNAFVHFFTFDVDDKGVWGLVRNHSNFFEVVEKPRAELDLDHAKAWGLILFHQEVGEDLFSALLQSSEDHRWKTINKAAAPFIPLNTFEDLTRQEYKP